ncbi:MAG: hypothetical protein ACXWR1_17725 [Bdellovibrionota bacterium]
MMLISLAPQALAGSTAEICQAHDDKADAVRIDAYFVSNLQEHGTQAFSRALRESARTQAKAFLDQRITDKRAELCAARLKLAEDIKSAGANYTTADCSAAAVVTLLDQYTTTVAAAFDQNRQALASLLSAHVKQLKLKLFDIAKGSTSGLEGNFGGVPLATAPKEIRFEWVKQEASKLGGEANVVWASASPDSNPLLQGSLVIAREAVHAKQERDAAKVRYHTDGRLSPSCKLR